MTAYLPEVGEYYVDLAAADLAYTQAASNAETLYRQAMQAADSALQAAIRQADQTAQQALQTEWDTVSTAWNAWEKESSTQKAAAENLYRKTLALAEQDRLHADVLSQTTSDGELQQTRAAHETGTIGHYATWITSVAGGHPQVTNAWNEWKRSLNGRTPTQAEVMEQALRIDVLFKGLWVFPK